MSLDPATDECFVDDETGVAECFALMRQLRPHLSSQTEFLEHWRRMTADGYRLLVTRLEGRPAALAGWRVQENLVYRRHLYIDDLVTDEALRRGALGQRLMTRLKTEALAGGCARLVLDTPLVNVLGHRFYYRNGLLATALRFNIVFD